MKRIKIPAILFSGGITINTSRAQDKMQDEKTVMVGGAAMYPSKNISGKCRKLKRPYHAGCSS